MNDQIVTIIVTAISSGAIIQALNIFLLPRAKKEDIAAEIRDELREDIKSYKNEVTELRNEVNLWRVRYFRVIELLLQNNIAIPPDLLDQYHTKITKNN